MTISVENLFAPWGWLTEPANAKSQTVWLTRVFSQGSRSLWHVCLGWDCVNASKKAHENRKKLFFATLSNAVQFCREKPFLELLRVVNNYNSHSSSCEQSRHGITLFEPSGGSSSRRHPHSRGELTVSFVMATRTRKNETRAGGRRRRERFIPTLADPRGLFGCRAVRIVGDRSSEPITFWRNNAALDTAVERTDKNNARGGARRCVISDNHLIFSLTQRLGSLV